MRVFVDGACAGNGTPQAKAGWGYVAKLDNGAVLRRNGDVPGEQTNNRAELYGLLMAASLIKQLHEETGLKAVELIMDSEIVVNGVLGKAKRRSNRDLWSQVEDLFGKLRGNVTVSIRHVPREANAEADALASQAANSLI